MFKQLVLTEKEHSFLVQLFTLIRNDMEEKRDHEEVEVKMRLTVPERMDLNEIMKRLLSWK